MKVAVSLVTVMGLTWITGVLVFHEDLVSLAYMFTMFVAFQVELRCMHACVNSLNGCLCISGRGCHGVMGSMCGCMCH